MTRTHAASRLLEHGPLTMRQFREITGWPLEQCRGTLDYLVERGRVVRRPITKRRALYGVAA